MKRTARESLVLLLAGDSVGAVLMRCLLQEEGMLLIMFNLCYNAWAVALTKKKSVAALEL
jgi:hypothetical protein